MTDPVAILSSGGLDSSVLLAEEAQQGRSVFPIFCRSGLIWEEAERAALERFRSTLPDADVGAVIELALPLGRLLGSDHWSLTGQGTPGAASPDEAVYLPGRNLTLLSVAAGYAARLDIPDILIATLKGNPFPDATPEFFASFSETASLAFRRKLVVRAPYRELTKSDLIRKWRILQLELTWSCLRPVGRVQCGVCNKCAERKKAFLKAGVPDLTEYRA